MHKPFRTFITLILLSAHMMDGASAFGEVAFGRIGYPFCPSMDSLFQINALAARPGSVPEFQRDDFASRLRGIAAAERVKLERSDTRTNSFAALADTMALLMTLRSHITVQQLFILHTFFYGPQIAIALNFTRILLIRKPADWKWYVVGGGVFLGHLCMIMYVMHLSMPLQAANIAVYLLTFGLGIAINVRLNRPRNGKIERLTISQARQALLSEMETLQKEYKYLAEILREMITLLQRSHLVAIDHALIRSAVQRMVEIRKHLDAANSLPSVTGLTDLQMQKLLNDFLTELATTFHADAVVVSAVGHYDVRFSYSRGLSFEQLRQFENDIQRLSAYADEQFENTNHDKTSKEGLEALTRLGMGTCLQAIPDFRLVGEDWNKELVVTLFRTKRSADYDGLFQPQDSAQLSALLDEQLRNGTAVWPDIKKQLRQEGYHDFDRFMTMVRHNASIPRWHDVLLPSIERIVTTMEESKGVSVEKVIGHLLWAVHHIEDLNGKDDVFRELLLRGEVFELLDLGPLIRYWAEAHQHLFITKGLEFVLDIPNDVPFLAMIDQKLFRILVDNLIENALKYTDQGHVLIRLAIGDFALHQWGPARAPEILKGIILRIADTGIGIPISDLENVFKAGERASNVHDRPGTGLGLHIVRWIANSMNGEVEIESKEGEGSTFTVFIPHVLSAAA